MRGEGVERIEETQGLEGKVEQGTSDCHLEGWEGEGLYPPVNES